MHEPMVLLHGVWMNEYRCWEPDIYAGGFKWPAKHDRAGEVFNFKNVDGQCYGHFELLGRSLRLEKLGASAADLELPGVLAVWTAPNPSKPGRTIVGWYRNATLYRNRIEPKGKVGSSRRFEGKIFPYQISAQAKDCRLLAPEERVLTIPPRKRTTKGLPGQIPIYYLSLHRSAAARVLERKIREFIQTGSAEPLGATRRRAGRNQPDPERRKKIEDEAVKLVVRHFKKLGYEINDCQKDNLGYDLVARKGDESLCIEVKGRAGVDVVADFSPNEFMKIRAQEADQFSDGSYRICVVTSALGEHGAPTLHHFLFVRSRKMTWCKIDEMTRVLSFDEVIAARAVA